MGELGTAIGVDFDYRRRKTERQRKTRTAARVQARTAERDKQRARIAAVRERERNRSRAQIARLKASYELRLTAARAKSAQPHKSPFRPRRPPHDYQSCADQDCQRPVCVAFKGLPGRPPRWLPAGLRQGIPGRHRRMPAAPPVRRNTR